MFIGILKIHLALHGNDSLKGKRKVLNKIKERVKNKFNVSISEVDYNDSHKDSLLGICQVSNDSRHLNSSLDSVIGFIDKMYVADIAHTDIEIMSMKDKYEKAF